MKVFRHAPRVLLAAVAVIGLLATAGCSNSSGVPRAPVAVKTTADDGLPKLPVGAPASGGLVQGAGVESGGSTAGGSTGDGAGSGGASGGGEVQPPAGGTSSSGVNTLIARMTIWYAKVAPLYSQLQADFDRMQSAVNAADEQAIKAACKSLQADAAALDAQPPAPDARTRSGLAQASNYVTKGAGECLAGSYDVGLQDFENAKEWAVAVKDRVAQIESAG